MEKAELTLDAAHVRDAISQYMLADGLKIVFDLERSRGSRIYDALTGSYYLDFFGCFATIPLGYGHPRLTSPEVLLELGQAAVQKPSNSDVYSVEMGRFVSTFARVAKPHFMKYLFFIDGGALAVENALKAAFDWKVRRSFAKGYATEKGHRVIHFKQAFHGRSGYTLSLTNTADPRKTMYFPKFADWPRVLNPKCTFPLEGENLDRTVADEEEALRQIHRAIAEDPDSIACIILEPIQGEGGDNHFRPEFHQALRRTCDENDLLLIYDEVQTGFGATGRMWACEHFVEPDIIAFGKKSQICGIMAGGRLDLVPDNVFHVSSRINSTWGGNLVDMVRSRLYLEIFEEERIVERSRELGERLLEWLRELQAEFPEIVSNARGRGLFCAVDLPSRAFRDEFLSRLFQKRLIMLGCGERSIRFRTALNIPEDDLYEGVQTIRITLRELT
jgi:L-lysine 6-transaminase